MDIFLALLPIDDPTALYAIFFGAILLTGIGLPIPEEIILLFGGYLSYLEFVNYPMMLVVLFLGSLSADILGYTIGRFFGAFLLRHLGKRSRIMRSIFWRAHAYFERYGEKVIMFSRPVMGVRVVIPILAGQFGMNFKRFILYDIVTLVPWVGGIVSLSYFLGIGLDSFGEVKKWRQLIFDLIGIAIIGYGIIRVIQFNAKTKNDDAAYHRMAFLFSRKNK